MIKKYNLGILATHPIQYYAPWYQALAKHPEINLKVFYCHHQTPEGQAQAGFGVPFDWDIPLFEGYEFQFLANVSKHPNINTFFGCDTPEITRIIREGSFDAFIVHGWHIKSFWQAITACWRTHTPVFIRGDSQLLTRRSVIKQFLKYPLYRWFMPKFDAYLVVGKRAKEYYLHYGADEKKMFFVPHSVDNDFFASRCAKLALERENLRRVWAIPQDAVVFLFAGKLIAMKRPADFLKALQLAHRHSFQIYGLVAGDGPLRSELESLARSNNLPVTFTGFLNQSEMPNVYAASDVLVLPSSGGETWGLIVNEAMACGLPAIVSDAVGCTSDLIFSGETGEIFPCKNIKKLAKIFVSIAGKREYLKNMGDKARKLIKNYSIADSVYGTLRAIHAVVGNKTLKQDKSHEKSI